MKQVPKLKVMVGAVRSVFLMSAVTAVSMGVPAIAFAQQASSTSTGAGTVDRVMVTAQKRDQALQDVPISVTAFSQSDLQRIGADGFADYANMVPGLTFQNRGPGQNRFVLRGISAPVSTSASTVGVYIDDLAVSELLNTPDIGMFDVNGVEVLRGPQGTLYGEGSMGGTVKIITNRPNLRKFENAVEGAVGKISSGGNTSDLNAMLNLPISDGVAALRVVGYARDHGGWIENVHPGNTRSDLNSTKTTGGRIALRVQPTAELDAQATVFAQQQKLGGFNSEIPNRPGVQSHSTVNEFRKDDFTIGNLVINYKFKGATLTSATSSINRDYVEDRDIGDFGFLPASGAQNTKAKFKSLTEELRLASSGAGNFFWVTGLFYKDYDYVENDTLTPAASLGAPTTITTKVKQAALFLDGTYRITPRLELAAGGRYSKDDQTTSYRSTVRVLPGATSSTNGFAPRVNLSWRPTDDSMYYANLAKGYRSGGVNRFYGLGFVARGLALEQATYNADSTVNFELGSKNSWNNGAFELNAALYRINWKDVQVFKGFALGFGIANGGKAHSQGIEAEMKFRPTKELTLGLQGTSQEAVYDQAVAGTTVVAGDRIYNATKVSYSAMADYEFAVSGARKAFIHADTQHVGDIVEIDKSRVLAPYTVLNLRSGIRWTSKWEFEAYVANATNKRAELAYNAQVKNIFTNQPRTIGVNLRGAF